MKTKQPHDVLSNFTILCWGAFIPSWVVCSPQAADWTPLRVFADRNVYTNSDDTVVIFTKLSKNVVIARMHVSRNFIYLYLITFYYSCPYYYPFDPLHPAPPLPQAVPPPSFMFMGHAYKVFGYSISYSVLPSPWLFCNYLFVLPNPLTNSPILPHAPPIWQPSKHSLYPRFHLRSSCVLSLFFRFSC